MKLIHRQTLVDDYFNYLHETEVIEEGGQRVVEYRKEPKPLDEIKTMLKERVTALRWEVMSSDITADNGAVIKTDAESIYRINTLIANLSNIEQVNFKAINGWYSITIEQLDGIINRITERTQKCFTAERRCHDEIDRIDNFESLRSYDWRLSFYQLIKE